MELRLVAVLLLVAVLIALVIFSGPKMRTRTRQPDTEPSGPDLNKRVPRPKRKGPLMEIKAEEDRYRTALRVRAQSAFDCTRDVAAKAGAKRYIWRTCADADVCPICSQKNGRRFAFDKIPAGGHPGDCETCSVGYCRCYAEPVIHHRLG